MTSARKRSENVVENFQKKVKPVVDRLKNGEARELWQKTRRDLGRRVDTSVHRVLSAMKIATVDDIVRMKAELGHINKRLNELDPRNRT
jgi:hypothetical protein